MIPEQLKKELVDKEMPNGWTTAEKQEAMAELILTDLPSTIVEIGVFGGRSLVAQAIALKHAAVPMSAIWGIDPWTVSAATEGGLNDANVDWWSNKIDIEEIREECLSGITSRGLWPWIRVIVAKSTECASLFNNIDILHIDGNHSDECSVRDVLLWVPKVKIGGWIWMDDCDWPETARAVSMLDARCDRVKQVGGCRLYRTK